MLPASINPAPDPGYSPLNDRVTISLGFQDDPQLLLEALQKNNSGSDLHNMPMPMH